MLAYNAKIFAADSALQSMHDIFPMYKTSSENQLPYTDFNMGNFFITINAQKHRDFVKNVMPCNNTRNNSHEKFDAYRCIPPGGNSGGNYREWLGTRL